MPAAGAPPRNANARNVMRTEIATVERVVIGFDASPPDPAALRIAAGLAAGLGAELAGLFVEDERLFRLAGLPFALELGFPSANARRLAPEDLARDLRAHAERVRRLMAGIAGPLKLSWTMTVTRGELPTAALAASAVSDLLVMAEPQSHPWSMDPAQAMVRAAGAMRPLMVLSGNTPASRRALSIAKMLGDASGCDVLAAVDAHEAAELRQWSARNLAPGRAAVRFLPLTRPGLPGLKQLAAIHRPCAVFLPRDGGDTGVPAVRLNCPVVLIGP